MGKSTAGADRFLGGSKVSGLAPLKKLVEGETIEVVYIREKRGKLSPLLLVQDLDTGEEYALPGHAALIGAELKVGWAYRISCTGKQQTESGRTFTAYDVTEESKTAHDARTGA